MQRPGKSNAKMPLNSQELLLAAEMVAECKEMKVTMKYSMMGAGIAAMTTMAGGILAGPLGLLAGATFGGLTAYSVSKDKFKPVHEVLRNDLTDSQRSRLAWHIENAIKDVDMMDGARLIMMITSNDLAIITLVYNALTMFLQSEMSCQIMP